LQRLKERTFASFAVASASARPPATSGLGAIAGRAQPALASGRGGARPSPFRAAPEIEAKVVEVRALSNDAWGGRKIKRALEDRGEAGIPAASTITAILRRHDRLTEAGSAEHPGPWTRFERASPNELWQMDFKGHFATHAGRCHPLTALDDHSRYNLILAACGDERGATVRRRLEEAFRRYGLPLAMLMDGGSPWSDPGGDPHTRFSVWLMRLGVRVAHGRPYHPPDPGQGGTLPPHLQGGGDERAQLWRPRRLPRRLRRLAGALHSRAAARSAWPDALRPTDQDGVFAVHYCAHRVGVIDLRGADEGACGLVDNAAHCPQGPQAQPQQQSASA
jgi:hypothetical protein